jgi:hypothetical protein
MGGDETVQEGGYWRRAYGDWSDNVRRSDQIPTILWEHALYDHLLHFVGIHEILRQVNQLSLGTRNATHTEHPQSGSPKVEWIPSPRWRNRAIILGVKY